MNIKSLLITLLVLLFTISDVSASEIEIERTQSEIVVSEHTEDVSSVEFEQVSEISSESELSTDIVSSKKIEVETYGRGPTYSITSEFKGEKLITHYRDDVRHSAELFYSTGEKHADYTYNDKSWVTYTEYDKNGNKISYQSRDDDLKMKERAWYHSNGQVKKIDNFYTNGRKSKYRTWNASGVKTDHQEYYNNSGSIISADYAYYGNGKVSEFIKRYDNGKMKERAWYFSSGQLRKVHNYYSNGRIDKVRYWNEKGIKTDHREYYNQKNTQLKADYAYHSNGKVSEFIKRYDNGKMKERAWYFSSGQLRKVHNYYSTGRIYMVRYWNEKGIKTDHREYYNQSNTQFKADYAYYDNGKVSEYIKWKSNGKRIEHVWIWKNGDSKNYKRIKRYNSKGQVYSDKSYKDRTVVSKPPVVTPSKPPVTNPPEFGYTSDSIAALGVDGCRKMINEDYAARNWIVDFTGEPNGRPAIWGDNRDKYVSCHVKGIPNGNQYHGRAYVVDNGDGTYDIGWQQVKY